MKRKGVKGGKGAAVIIYTQADLLFKSVTENPGRPQPNTKKTLVGNLRRDWTGIRRKKNILCQVTKLHKIIIKTRRRKESSGRFWYNMDIRRRGKKDMRRQKRRSQDEERDCQCPEPAVEDTPSIKSLCLAPFRSTGKNKSRLTKCLQLGGSIGGK